MEFSAKAIQISDKFIKKLQQYGAKFTLFSVSLDKKIPSTTRDEYSEFFGQSKNHEPTLSDKFYTLHGLITFSPDNEKRIGAGLKLDCDIIIENIMSKSLHDVGIAVASDSVKDIMDKLLLNRLIDLNGQRYTIEEVAPANSFGQTPLTFNISCKEYKANG